MSVRSGQSITKVFTTRVFSTGVATNADSLPTGTLYVNGTADAASVTVTNITTGIYKAAVTLPTLAVGDVVDLRIAATVSSVADTEVIWSDTKDIVIDASGLADATTVKLGPSGSATAQTARDLGANIDAAISTRSTYAGADTAGTTTLLSRLTSTRATLLDNLDAAITTRMATFTYTTPPTAAAIVTAIMTDLLSGTDFNTVGSFGKLVKDYLDAAVSTRLAASGYTAPDNTTIGTISTNIGANGAGLTAIGDTRLGNLDAAVSTRLATAGYTAAPTAAQNRIEMDTNSTKLAHLDADVSSRLATAGYTAPDNASASSAASSAATAATQATNAATQTTAANIRTAVGLASANLDSQLGAIPTTFRLKKNTAFSGFSLVMFNTSGVAATGKTVSGSVSIDGGAFGTLTNSVSEIGSGAYKVNLAAADTNGNDLLFLFTATDCKPLFLKVITQP